MKRLESRVLVTGASGFLGKNLVCRLEEVSDAAVATFDRGDDISVLAQHLGDVDVVVHLAGENRPENDTAFQEVNVGLTATLCGMMEEQYQRCGRRVALIYASSVQAEQDNPYGHSKRQAEQIIEAAAEQTGGSCTVFRFPGVFGKWCKPDYNSVVATFCYRIARGLEIKIDEPSRTLELCYVDDVIDAILTCIRTPSPGFHYAKVSPQYEISVQALANHLLAFHRLRDQSCTERVGSGLLRALYATYVSYLPLSHVSYPLQAHADSRGTFVEMLKTADCGQFSIFTTQPGARRGGHYHHSKTEKFLVVTGQALFRFRCVITGEVLEVTTSGDHPEVVETIPGWAHQIINIGAEEMTTVLWSNEVFDPEHPDTVSYEV